MTTPQLPEDPRPIEAPVPVGAVPAAVPPALDEPESALAVFANRPFLLLWLSQAATQIGGNMVLYGLTVIILGATSSNTAVSVLILTFLVPAVLFSALAGVYVDRLDKRLVLVVTNVLRAVAFVLMYLVGTNVALILALNIFVSTVTVFFAPAEAAMIPRLVPRHQLLAANGIFTLTLNAAFALGFALVGPVVVTIAGAPALLLIVMALYLVAAVFCWTLPPSPPTREEGIDPREVAHDAERAVGSTVAQLQEGLAFIRLNPQIKWSLIYLGIAASLVGVLGVLGPDFAVDTLRLEEKDFVVVVLPLGIGIVMGILVLNSFGKYLPRRRVIEGGLMALGVLLASLAVAGPISRFLSDAESSLGLVDLSALTSLLAIVVLIAFLAGVAYGFVAITAQTQLQEDLPEDVRGRIFGILNMLVSIASFLPIIIVGPVSDLFGTTAVLLVVALSIGLAGLASVFLRGPATRTPRDRAVSPQYAAAVDPIGVALTADLDRQGSAGRHGGEPIALGEGAPRGDAEPAEPVAAVDDVEATDDAPDGPREVPDGEPIAIGDDELDPDATLVADAPHDADAAAGPALDPDADPDTEFDPARDRRPPEA